MKILVTGASGFLGREVMPCLGRDQAVTGLAHSQTGGGFRVCDLRDADALRAVLDDEQPDTVVHLAAYREPDFCEENPEECARLNVAPTHTLCAHLPAACRLIYVSTDYAFNGTSPPYGELDPPDPINVYGASKVASEQIALSRPNSVALRVPLLVGAGPTLSQSGFIGQMVEAIRDPAPQPVDDVLMRFPTWTRDVAEGIAFLLAEDADGVFHLSGARGATRYAWTVEIARMLGLDCPHLTPSAEVIPRLATRPPNSQLADARIHRAGFRPSTDFADAIRIVLTDLGES